MFEQLVAPLIDNTMDLLIEGAFLALAGLLTWAANTLRQKLGAERTAILRKSFDEALNRAIVAHAEQGFEGKNLANVVQSYVQDTMSDTLKALKSTPETLAQRVQAQIAQRLQATRFMK